MALQLTKKLPRNITVSYWIVWEKQVNHKLKRSYITMVGYMDHQDRVDHFLIPLQIVSFEFNDDAFPFSYSTDETITAYDKIKSLVGWQEAVDC